ncbi:carboxypeptidase-like regulatory domain-containing protein [Flavobacterium chuncheonense]|uniref:Carboxypeptidase-like regulatory domain-containing protein n=1 Tax=Flavobacterium chuncheonense TaxID=2026653 RepID=A0ABW5YN06_9FLAO
MRKILFFFIVLLTQLSFAQDNGAIQGTITDENQVPISGANAQILSLKKGTITDFDGKFKLIDIPAGNYSLEISYVGYEKQSQNITVFAGQTATVNVSLKETTGQLNEVIVSLNKQPQKITDVPATVDIIKAAEINEYASFNVGELAARQKGVDFVRSGVLGTGINIRGFNSAFNSKNLQVTDDRVATLVATGLPLGSFETVIKEDIEQVEILLGPNGTLYGPNAHNGLVSTITKNPRNSEGTTFAAGGGSQNVFTTRLRHAQALNDKFAFKINFESTQGTEFKYTDTVYVGNQGYAEKNLDRDFTSLKYGTGLYYKTSEKSELIGYYGHSNSNNIGNTNAGRNQIKDWSIDQAQLKFVSPRLFFNTYYTWSRTDDTYAMNQRTQNYVSFINNGFSEEEAWNRSLMEQWFPTGPDTGIALQRGALFVDHSDRFNAEGQYNNNWGRFHFIGGAQYQRDMADSKGTYLLDQDGPIELNQIGVYSQIEYRIPESRWAFLAAARLDNHELYGSNFLPKLSVTKSLNTGTFRLTYGRGMAVPSILNLKANMFGGLILGNGEGFTLSNGTKIDKLEVETINSYEIGYKGRITKNFYTDINAYYNQSDNFISPLRNIADPANGVTVTHMGDKPIGEVVPGSTGSTILTYANFGHVDTYGIDVGLNYYFTDNFRTSFNYSYFGRDLDKNDLSNDGNLDGKVLETELPINTPTNKFTLGFHYNNKKFYGAIFGRYVEKYDFFSGINIAAKTQDLDGDGVNDIFENQQNGRTWNYGQLGGFTIDSNIGYNFTEKLSAGLNVTNLFDVDIREFVGSPIIKRLISVELKYTVDFFRKKETTK